MKAIEIAELPSSAVTFTVTPFSRSISWLQSNW
jgi:hypothetical protein